MSFKEFKIKMRNFKGGKIKFRENKLSWRPKKKQLSKLLSQGFTPYTKKWLFFLNSSMRGLCHVKNIFFSKILKKTKFLFLKLWLMILCELFDRWKIQSHFQNQWSRNFPFKRFLEPNSKIWNSAFWLAKIILFFSILSLKKLKQIGSWRQCDPLTQYL